MQRGKHDTTRNISCTVIIISCFPLHFMLYRRKSIAFGTDQGKKCENIQGHKCQAQSLNCMHTQKNISNLQAKRDGVLLGDGVQFLGQLNGRTPSGDHGVTGSNHNILPTLVHKASNFQEARTNLQFNNRKNFRKPKLSLKHNV